MLGIAICFNIFIGFKWKFMCTKICGSNLRSMSSGKVIHTQMVALVALVAFFFFFLSIAFAIFIAAAFFSRPALLDWTFLYAGTRVHSDFNHLILFFCHWLNRWSHSTCDSQPYSDSSSKLKLVHFQSFKQLKLNLSIFQHRLSMSSLLQN